MCYGTPNSENERQKFNGKYNSLPKSNITKLPIEFSNHIFLYLFKGTFGYGDQKS